MLYSSWAILFLFGPINAAGYGALIAPALEYDSGVPILLELVDQARPQCLYWMSLFHTGGCTGGCMP